MEAETRKQLNLIDRYLEASFALVAVVVVVSSIALFTGDLTGAQYAWLNGVLTLAFSAVRGLVEWHR